MAIKKGKKKVEEIQVVDPIVELQAEEATATTPIVSFSVWYTMRQSKIPAIHKMGIIKADFEARGIKEEEPLEVFDEALKKYGININN